LKGEFLLCRFSAETNSGKKSTVQDSELNRIRNFFAHLIAN
jgi:hypothetical protein